MAKVYDGFKAEWVEPKSDRDKLNVAIAEASVKGGKLPIDRTEDDMRRLEPGMGGAGPVLTANENTVDLDRAGTGGGGTAGARTR